MSHPCQMTYVTEAKKKYVTVTSICVHKGHIKLSEKVCAPTNHMKEEKNCQQD